MWFHPTGTVEAIDPAFLSRWNVNSQSSVQLLNQAFLDAQQHPSVASMARLKDQYLRTFPDASPARKLQVQGAKTASSVAALFYSGLGGGMRIRFHVQTLFNHADDDDDAAPKKAEKETQPDSFVVWTPFGDCGFPFQTGETYLVYATDDSESSNSITTGSCTRTRRLSDAGEDLAYLYFYKDHPDSSTRLEGFTTTNQRYRLDSDPLHPEAIQSTVAGTILELRSDSLLRYVESDLNGRFVFDGLPAGDYKLSAFAHGYPIDAKPLSDPQPFHLQKQSCALQIMLLPPK